jgi:hypothetical protein
MMHSPARSAFLLDIIEEHTTEDKVSLVRIAPHPFVFSQTRMLHDASSVGFPIEFCKVERLLISYQDGIKSANA